MFKLSKANQNPSKIHPVGFKPTQFKKLAFPAPPGPRQQPTPAKCPDVPPTFTTFQQPPASETEGPEAFSSTDSSSDSGIGPSLHSPSSDSVSSVSNQLSRSPSVSGSSTSAKSNETASPSVLVSLPDPKPAQHSQREERSRNLDDVSQRPPISSRRAAPPPPPIRAPSVSQETRPLPLKNVVLNENRVLAKELGFNVPLQTEPIKCTDLSQSRLTEVPQLEREVGEFRAINNKHLKSIGALGRTNLTIINIRNCRSVNKWDHLDWYLEPNRLNPETGKYEPSLLLTKLDISGTGLRTLCKMREQTKLTELDISKCRISSSDFVNLAGHPSLNTLKVNGEERKGFLGWIRNLFSDHKRKEIPDAVFTITPLETLEFGNQNLQSVPQGLKELKNLRKLDLRNNRLEFIPKDAFTHPKEGAEEPNKIKNLNLSKNNLKFIPKEAIEKLENLQELDVRNNANFEFELDVVEENKNTNIKSENKFYVSHKNGKPWAEEPIFILNGREIKVHFEGTKLQEKFLAYQKKYKDASKEEQDTELKRLTDFRAVFQRTRPSRLRSLWNRIKDRSSL